MTLQGQTKFMWVGRVLLLLTPFFLNTGLCTSSICANGATDVFGMDHPFLPAAAAGSACLPQQRFDVKTVSAFKHQLQVYV